MEIYFDKYGKQINLGDYICIGSNSYEVTETLAYGWCIKTNNRTIDHNFFKENFYDGKTIYSLKDLNLLNIFICSEEDYPECYV